mgnify:CR=1 FL=1
MLQYVRDLPQCRVPLTADLHDRDVVLESLHNRAMKFDDDRPLEHPASCLWIYHPDCRLMKRL